MPSLHSPGLLCILGKHITYYIICINNDPISFLISQVQNTQSTIAVSWSIRALILFTETIALRPACKNNLGNESLFHMERNWHFEAGAISMIDIKWFSEVNSFQSGPRLFLRKGTWLYQEFGVLKFFPQCVQQLLLLTQRKVCAWFHGRF